MNIACPECSTVYRVDPGRVPDTGVAAECRTCGSAFRVDPSMGPTAPGEVVTALRVARAPVEPSVPEPEAETEGPPEGGAAPETAEGPQVGEREEQGPEVGGPEAEEGTGAGEPEAVEPEAGEPVAEAEGAAAGSRPGASGEVEAAEEEPAPATSGPATAEAPAFGPQDPDTRARRLARALVSDIKVYHPERWEESVQTGSLRTDFRDEILKSWEEYVEQVGEEMAKRTPYFRDALNEILAQGERVF